MRASKKGRVGVGLVRGCRGSRASEKGAVGVGLVRGCRGSREDAGHPLIALRVFHVGAPVMQRALFSDRNAAVLGCILSSFSGVFCPFAPECGAGKGRGGPGLSPARGSSAR